MLFIMLQHKLICRSILPISFVVTGASLSLQFLPCVNILLKTLSQYKLSLLHAVFCGNRVHLSISDHCVATKEILL